jgi:hypothetical protein
LVPVCAAFAPFADAFKAERARAATAAAAAVPAVGADPAAKKAGGHRGPAVRRLRFNLWPIVSAARELSPLLPHQNMMLQRIVAFIAAAQRALEAAAPAPAAAAPVPAAKDARAYLVWCDRLLLLYNSVAEPDEAFDQRKEPVLTRLVSTMLTRLFSVNYYRRDAAYKSLLFVWLADPWLRRCREANLFADEALRPPPGFAKKRHAALGQWAPLLFDALNRAPVSGHELYRYFHQTVPTPGPG